MTPQGQIIVDVKRATTQPYAWPGGYPLFVILNDGAALCTDCAKKELGLIVTSTAQQLRDGWQAAGVAVNWEDVELTCDHCSQVIECAYGHE